MFLLFIKNTQKVQFLIKGNMLEVLFLFIQKITPILSFKIIFKLIFHL